MLRKRDAIETESCGHGATCSILREELDRVVKGANLHAGTMRKNVLYALRTGDSMRVLGTSGPGAFGRLSQIFISVK
jgi:hypothetical protein